MEYHPKLIPFPSRTTSNFFDASTDENKQKPIIYPEIIGRFDVEKNEN